MKKWFIYASVVGLAAGAVYWLCKNSKTNTATSQTVDKKADFETNTQEEEKEKEVLESVRELNPGNLDVRTRLISLYDSLGHKEEARDEAKAILLYDGKNLSAIEYLSRESEFYALLYSSLKPKEEEPSSPETEEEESNNTDTL